MQENNGCIDLLLVDVNRGAIPIYWALKKQEGVQVWVVGANEEEPLALAEAGKGYLKLDYGDVAALERVVGQLGIQFLIPGCTDVSYRSCAAIRGERFPQIERAETIELLLDKRKFKGVAREFGVPVPKEMGFEEAVVSGRDVVVKPVDAFSGRGMSVVREADKEGLRVAVELAQKVSAKGEVVIEEFVQGQLFSYSAFVVGKQVIADFVVREDCVAVPFAVDCSYVDFAFDARIRGELRAGVERMALGLGFVDGLVHVQFLERGGDFWVVEVTRRCPGDLYSLLVEFSTGYGYAENYAKGFLGERIAGLNAVRDRHWVVRHTVTFGDGARWWGLGMAEKVKVRYLVPLGRMGQWLERAPGGRGAIVFFEVETEKERDMLYEKLMCGQLMQYKFEGLR